MCRENAPSSDAQTIVTCPAPRTAIDENTVGGAVLRCQREGQGADEGGQSGRLPVRAAARRLAPPRVAVPRGSDRDVRRAEQQRRRRHDERGARGSLPCSRRLPVAAGAGVDAAATMREEGGLIGNRPSKPGEEEARLLLSDSMRKMAQGLPPSSNRSRLLFFFACISAGLEAVTSVSRG